MNNLSKTEGEQLFCHTSPCSAWHDNVIGLILRKKRIAMSNEDVIFCFDSTKRVKLDAAVGIERDRSDAIDEAINLSPEIHQWQLEKIHKGIAEANAGDFASEEEVQAVFARLTDAN